MLYVSCRRISLADYQTLLEAGIKVNLVEPPKLPTYLWLGKTKPAKSYLPIGNGGIKPQVSVSTQVPYARIK